MINWMKRDNVCAACQQRTCCYHYKVPLTGRDLVRISKTLGMSPHQFTVAVTADPESELALALDRGGVHYELVLGKSTEPRRYGGCLFLVQTNAGVHRCGLGETSPDQCKLYPVHFEAELLQVINDEQGCWRSWSVTEFDVDTERRRSRDYERHKSEYLTILAEWNRRVQANGEREYSFEDFCNYLENRYASLET